MDYPKQARELFDLQPGDEILVTFYEEDQTTIIKTETYGYLDAIDFEVYKEGTEEYSYRFNGWIILGTTTPCSKLLLNDVSVYPQFYQFSKM